MKSASFLLFVCACAVHEPKTGTVRQALVDPNTPWKNPYEAPAYARECEVYWGQIAKGWPPGSWKPMGVQLGLCSG